MVQMVNYSGMIDVRKKIYVYLQIEFVFQFLMCENLTMIPAFDFAIINMDFISYMSTLTDQCHDIFFERQSYPSN